ncbi:hypothetical protein N1851_022165 [Merluccius polli]|uniref:Nbr1 FW domain-containing protein n=1 Tax=Merluccius polli TaxID=89951 RepID=A0AA47NYR3_MERPO|nr:hypothetical protein N1851_022165 [Merluccius polli]
MDGMDMDVDAELMQRFSCMGTTDKDVLVSEFQRLLGFQLNPAGCAFFLDMTNWLAGHHHLLLLLSSQDKFTRREDVEVPMNMNLQAAIGAYYDFESPNVNAPSMSFVEDVTIGEGESVPPDTAFTKTWRIQNTGAESWPPGVCLKYIGGDQFGHVNMVLVKSLDPQEMFDVSVQMHSPAAPGMYQGQWRMCTATGLFYGDVIWVILSVEVGGLLGVTQQLSSFETEFNTQPQRHPQGDFNPFASPQKNKGEGGERTGLKDGGGPWETTPDPIQTEQNGVNRTSGALQTNLPVVTYGQVRAWMWWSEDGFSGEFTDPFPSDRARSTGAPPTRQGSVRKRSLGSRHYRQNLTEMARGSSGPLGFLKWTFLIGYGVPGGVPSGSLHLTPTLHLVVTSNQCPPFLADHSAELHWQMAVFDSDHRHVI